MGGKQTIDEDVIGEYARRTWVKPFPNEAFARDVLEGKLTDYKFGATPSDLETYRANLLQRIVGKK